jgi:hypothetical protein
MSLEPAAATGTAAAHTWGAPERGGAPFVPRGPGLQEKAVGAAVCTPRSANRLQTHI